jgi:hypothetical protein
MLKTAVTSPDEYIAALDEPRRTQIREIDELITATAPQLERHVQSGMLAYGRYHYRYASGREGDWFRIGLASHKRYISLYVTAADGERYLAETYKDRLRKADIGKSCVRFTKLEDLDRSALASLIREGATAATP